tara:strand:+ start:2133 stop:3065 length:933 start_codon:yes stop_codon:yes gene_type:complete
MKVYTLAPNENWICDRFVNEWNENYPELRADSPYDCDILWLLADWCWSQIDYRRIDKSRTKIIASVHHLVPQKFNENSLREWSIRDSLIDYYHVPCLKTRDQIINLTKKPIFAQPFWVNGDIWKEKKDKNKLRKLYNIKEDSFLVGSFQRDTEGHDLISPKLEKGPDFFIECVKQLRAKHDNLKVLLAGWRRQYVIKRLEDLGIDYYYQELPDFKVINDLYNCLDLYIVSARYEGGPQAIVECALTKTPIVSTDVGLAPEILQSESIFKISDFLFAEPNVEFAFNNVSKITIPSGFNPFVSFFKKCITDS